MTKLDDLNYRDRLLVAHLNDCVRHRTPGTRGSIELTEQVMSMLPCMKSKEELLRALWASAQFSGSKVEEMFRSSGTALTSSGTFFWRFLYSDVFGNSEVYLGERRLVTRRLFVSAKEVDPLDADNRGLFKIYEYDL